MLRLSAEQLAFPLVCLFINHWVPSRDSETLTDIPRSAIGSAPIPSSLNQAQLARHAHSAQGMLSMGSYLQPQPLSGQPLCAARKRRKGRLAERLQAHSVSVHALSRGCRRVLQVSGDPRRPAEAHKYERPKVNLDEQPPDMFLLMGLALGLLSLIFKVGRCTRAVPARCRGCWF